MPASGCNHVPASSLGRAVYEGRWIASKADKPVVYVGLQKPSKPSAEKLAMPLWRSIAKHAARGKTLEWSGYRSSCAGDFMAFCACICAITLATK